MDATGHERLEFADLVGHLTVRDSTMVFEDGPLTLAMRQGAIFLFYEIDLCSPATLAGLNSILDGSPLCIAEKVGELVTPHPMFRFAATANTNGGSRPFSSSGASGHRADNLCTGSGVGLSRLSRNQSHAPRTGPAHLSP